MLRFFLRSSEFLSYTCSLNAGLKQSRPKLFFEMRNVLFPDRPIAQKAGNFRQMFAHSNHATKMKQPYSSLFYFLYKCGKIYVLFPPEENFALVGLLKS